MGATVDYALTHRLIVGGRPGLYFSCRFGDSLQAPSTSYTVRVSPFVRYYLVNTGTTGVDTQASTRLGYGNGSLYGLQNLDREGGVQFRVAPNVRFGPVVSHGVQEGTNGVSLGARIELKLGMNAVDIPGRVPALYAASVMLGSQIGSFSYKDRQLYGTASLGAHYFFTGRLAGGLALRGSTSYINI